MHTDISIQFLQTNTFQSNSVIFPKVTVYKAEQGFPHISQCKVNTSFQLVCINGSIFLMSTNKSRFTWFLRSQEKTPCWGWSNSRSTLGAEPWKTRPISDGVEASTYGGWRRTR